MFRGRGIYQPAVDDAIDRLDEGGYVRDCFHPSDSLLLDYLALGTPLR